MSDENLGAVLDEEVQQVKRQVALQNLGKRTHLTLGQMAKLVAHEEHGAAVRDITLQELVEVAAAGDGDAAPAKKKGSKKKSGKKSGKKSDSQAKKKSSKKKAKKAKKKSGKKKGKSKKAKKSGGKKSSGGKKGPKADKGKPKPRLDYATGKREVLAAIKAAGKPVGRSDIENATGYSGVQVRTFCKELAKERKIEILGKGGRSTRYAPPGSGD